MHDAGKVIIGLVIALLIFTFPVLFNAVGGGEQETLVIDPGVPEGVSACVRDTEFMRREHMTLLMDWRDEVVRDGDRIDEESGYVKSLTGTCIGCHQSPQDFCFKCHEYASVKTPYCWECHIDPTGGQ